ncbi:6024_t:CDS:2, partial [Gigaspora margarita]
GWLDKLALSNINKIKDWLEKIAKSSNDNKFKDLLKKIASPNHNGFKDLLNEIDNNSIKDWLIQIITKLKIGICLRR